MKSTRKPQRHGDHAFAKLALGLRDSSPVSGLTHAFYKYPARFSPSFAAAALQAFSNPGDTVLDPFMGGATAVVEGVRLGRRMIGSDINSLAVFLAQVKTSPLTRPQISALEFWADGIVPALRIYDLTDGGDSLDDLRRRNLHLPAARHITSLTQAALETIALLPDAPSRRFARCVLLNAAQWALHGRRRAVTTAAFRVKVQRVVHTMLGGLRDYCDSSDTNMESFKPEIIQSPASRIHLATPFSDATKVDLVLTSPPYPGIHVLYHRWQVNGRRETPAPYWITNTQDGKGSAYYNLGDRRKSDATDYFANLDSSLSSIRKVMRDGAMFVQLVAFANSRRDLPRYLAALEDANFSEVLVPSWKGRRLRRRVPGRAWHATLKGKTSASREILLLHRAV